jgi:branched-chain amino acid transport system ATP-binding protein
MSLTDTPAPPHAGRGPLAEPLLDIRGVEVTYEKVEVAVRGLNIQVPEGRITAVLGANGAGKTTLLRAIGGFLPGEHAVVSDGEIRFEGRVLNGMQPHKVTKLGIAMVPERDKIFPTLTVDENLRVSVGAKTSNGRGSDLRETIDEMFPVLVKRRKDTAGYLSGGERQMLAIAATVLCNPRLMMVDELSLGLAPKLVTELFGLVKSLSAELGLTVLMVEQDAMAALSIADYAYVIENGRIVLDGTPERLLAHEDVREFYLGLGSGDTDARSYADVKQYTRTRRWWG